MKVDFKDAPAETLPRCPHCQAELQEIWVQKQGLGVQEQKQLLICPACRALLGFGVFTR